MLLFLFERAKIQKVWQKLAAGYRLSAFGYRLLAVGF